jgi:hypothetical protein
MPRLEKVFVPPTAARVHSTERAALALAHRNCDGINVQAGVRRCTTGWEAVALLRSDQDWMVPHLRERGLAIGAAVTYTVGKFTTGRREWWAVMANGTRLDGLRYKSMEAAQSALARRRGEK